MLKKDRKTQLGIIILMENLICFLLWMFDMLQESFEINQFVDPRAKNIQ